MLTVMSIRERFTRISLHGTRVPVTNPAGTGVLPGTFTVNLAVKADVGRRSRWWPG